jgi:RNA polymerase sigma-70 factor (sigma-E family)
MHEDAERVYAAYVDGRAVRLRRTAYRLCGGWHAAEDLVQETLIRLYTRWDRVIDAAALDAYVYRILVRLYLAQTRQPWFRRVVSGEVPDAPAPAGSDVGDRLDVAAALKQLPPGQRAVLVLRFYEGLDVAETARALCRSTGTVKSQTSVAMSKLRDLLPGYFGTAYQPTGKTRSER